jgi:hypothetical protein
MALARRGTRVLTVEGTRYRWVVSPGDEPGLGIVVEAADSPGQRMVAWVEHGNTISPWLVRAVILRARAQGWQPQARGPDCVLRLDNPSIQEARREWLEVQLPELCDHFQSHVHDLEDVREFARVGEHALAFETLCDRFTDADDAPKLSIPELERLARLGEELGCRARWVNLIACMQPADLKRIPPWLRTLAEAQLRTEVPGTPVRREWLQRLRELIQGRPTRGP